MELTEDVLVKLDVSAARLIGNSLKGSTDKLRGCPDLNFAHKGLLNGESGKLISMDMGLGIQAIDINDTTGSINYLSTVRLRYGSYVSHNRKGKEVTLWKHTVGMTLQALEQRLTSRSLYDFVTTLLDPSEYQGIARNLDDLVLSSQMDELGESLIVGGRTDYKELSQWK